MCALFLPLSDVVAKWFFDGQMVAVPDIVALLLGCVIFAFIPFATVQSWADRLGQSSQEFAIRSIVNRTKNNLSRKLYDLSEVFFEMKHSFSAVP